MSASTDRQSDLPYRTNNQERYGEFDDSEIARWVHDQQRARTDGSFPRDETEGQETQENSTLSYGAIADGRTASSRSSATGPQQSGQIAADTIQSSQHHGANIRDDTERESASGRGLRLAIICFVVTTLGVGSALAWRSSSAISTWAKGAVSFFRPVATKPAPTTEDLAQRIDALTNQIGALKQQINQLNAGQTQINAAQAQSARSAAEQQLKIAALQQLLDQRAQAPKSPHPSMAVKKKPLAAVSQPRPKPKPEAAMPLTIVPPPTAQR